MKGSNIKEMRAISVIQPWAHCIIHEGKNIENRPRITHYRGTVLIHASKKKDPDRFLWLSEDYNIDLEIDDLSFGAIIGIADIVEVITKRQVDRKTKKWFMGKYGYILENMKPLKKPIPTKGALGFWKVKGRLLRRCLNQLGTTSIKKIQPFEKL